MSTAARRSTIGFADVPALSRIGRLAARRGVFLLVLVCALTAVLAGLSRIGFSIAFGSTRVMQHGPLLVVGVFGTLISLERAVALAKPWSHVAPALAGCSALALLTGLPAAPWLAVASSFALVLVNLAIVHRQSAAFTWLMAWGSLVFLGGALAYARGKAIFELVPSWMGFFVLTIVAERLELSRLAPTPRWASRLVQALAVLCGAFAAAPACDLAFRPRAFGLTLVALGAWQLRFDLARRTIRSPGPPRFAALGILLGAIWLCGAGATLLLLGLPPAGPIYDAVLHQVFVGFVLSMAFAHAPIILPAVARFEVPFHTALYGPLVLLHLTVALRVVGDVAALPRWRQLGALGNALAMALFLGTLLFARVRAARWARNHPVSRGA